MKRKKDDPLADPLSWRPVKAPSLAEMEVIAIAAFEKLPEKFRALCKGVIIHIDDFPSDEVVSEMNLESEFGILGLFQGVGLPFQSDASLPTMPNMVWLYRRP
ncbi:MAG: metallopeptidase family protein, partial [Pseudorhodoplanes sp.]